jgi:predicted nucleotidyltransferase
MKALNFYNENLPIGEIDIVFESPIPYDKLRVRSVKVELQGEKVPLISIHDLIELKIKAGRKQDLTDAEHLKRILEK